jgi:transposase
MIIPDNDFITALLNIRKEDIEACTVTCQSDTVFYHLTLKRKEENCSCCGGRLEGHGYGREKPVNHPTLTERKSVILYRPRRYRCRDCGKTFTQENPFAFRSFRESYALQRNVLKKLGDLHYTLKMISEELHISATQVSRYLDSYITIPKRPLPVCLGIDEIHNPELSYRGSAYLCVLVDNEKRCLYEVMGSRIKSHLDNELRKYPKEEKEAVRYVTIDMWEAYKELAEKHFKKAVVAVDPFHVIEHLCRDFTKVRLRIMNQAVYGSNVYYLLKKWHWLLEKDNVFLDNEKRYNSHFGRKLNYRDLYDMILENIPELSLAYHLKERYRFFNKQMSYEEAEGNYDAMVREFEEADIKEYREFVSILKNWKKEILNSFLRPYENRRLSNAFCENVNGKIRTYLTLSRGVSNFRRFRKRILYALNPDIYYSLTEVLSSEKLPGRKRGAYKKKEG